MYNPEKLAPLHTQDKQTNNTIQKTKKMSNSKMLNITIHKYAQ